MKKRLKLMLCLLLVAVMLITVACNNSNAGPSTTSTKETDGGDVTETEDVGLEDIDINGADFTIAWSNPYNHNEVAPLEEDALAGSIDEAVWNRNMLVEDLTGAHIVGYHVSDWQQMLIEIEKECLSQEGTFDAYCGSIYYQFVASVSNYLYDLKTLTKLNTENEWWDQGLNEMYSFQSKNQYYIGGDINYCDDYGQNVLFFNIKLLEDSSMELPYDLVRNGDWTVDAMYQYVQNFSKDNGDGVWDKNDTYGAVLSAGELSFMICGFGTTMIRCTGPGELSLNEERKVADYVGNVFQKFFAYGNPDVIIAERDMSEGVYELFQNGKALFQASSVTSILEYRYKMEDDFGILPYPKFNEDQEGYYCAFNTPWATAYSIPSVSPDAETVGLMLDYMGSVSHDTVYKTAIEVNAMNKLLRDENTAEMLDLIFKSKIYDLGMWPTAIYAATNTMVYQGFNSWASTIANVKDKVNAEYYEVPNYYTD